MSRTKQPMSQISKWAKWKRLQRASPGGKTGGGTCSRCGKSMARLNIHHKDVNKSNDSPSNLSRVCDACHAQVDSKVIHGKVSSD